MSAGVEHCSPESGEVKLNLEETELTLGLPGESRGRWEISPKSGDKRSFSQTVDLNLGRTDGDEDEQEENNGSSSTKTPPAKTAAVGWPPVRASRKNVIKRMKLVKVAVDGAPYLRKVDLELYKSYSQLLSALQNMFSCSAIRDRLNEGKANGVEYLPTYEDGDGDWMLVGDMPWKMFVESCKKLRLMKSSEAMA